jgi:hypothetical protein
MFDLKRKWQQNSSSTIGCFPSAKAQYIEDEEEDENDFQVALIPPKFSLASAVVPRRTSFAIFESSLRLQKNPEQKAEALFQ